MDTNVDDVCKLLRSTGFARTPAMIKRPPKYPEDYFGLAHACILYDVYALIFSVAFQFLNISSTWFWVG